MNKETCSREGKKDDTINQAIEKEVSIHNPELMQSESNLVSAQYTVFELVVC